MKKLTINIALSFALTISMLGCTSTTTTGTVGVKRKQLMLLSRQQVEQISAKSYAKELAHAKRTGKLDTNPAQLARLKRIVNRLIPYTTVYRPDAVNWQWEVHTTKSDSMNAYVLSGGKIMFYTGIIDNLNLTDAEISAIVGHEMAHALREHNREHMSSSVATSLGIDILATGFGLSRGEAQLAGIVGDLGINLPHSRVQEKEADLIGLELMARAGYNPQSAITLWQKMQQKKSHRVPQMLSTHPNSQKRIIVMKNLMPKVLPLYQNKNVTIGRNTGKINYQKFNKSKGLKTFEPKLKTFQPK